MGKLDTEGQIDGSIRGIRQSITSLEVTIFTNDKLLRDLPDTINQTRAELYNNAETMNNALDSVPIDQTRKDIKDITEEFEKAKGSM